ncbi:hypothetical protein AYO20_04117 [Fonsecaea nubica]|uniref:Uncharacterized protein n=1 Tax=Fonsecaea nubica TaxID=856822 RepID=A0A178D5L7_9EURO|nr:hypothetical protein AYO20_04117 [Fonsecaea nubica]OAL36501.1 hypothetical protein AYO20_04117 [Fonsecaea nubica]
MADFPPRSTSAFGQFWPTSDCYPSSTHLLALLTLSKLQRHNASIYLVTRYFRSECRLLITTLVSHSYYSRKTLSKVHKLTSTTGLMSRSDHERSIEQQQNHFVLLVERLRCYGRRCSFPACCESAHTRQNGSPQPNDLLAQTKANDEAIARLHQACTTLGVSDHVEEFAQHLFRDFFMPVTPEVVGVMERAGIAACIWTSCSEHNPDISKDQVCLAVNIGMEGMEPLQYSLEKVQASYAKSRNRYFKRKLRARSVARGAVYDHATRRRRRLCGRDVTGELRAQIFILASRL